MSVTDRTLPGDIEGKIWINTTLEYLATAPGNGMQPDEQQTSNRVTILMRFFLIGLHLIFIFLLLPWIPMPFWFTAFLSDDIGSLPFNQLFTIKNGILTIVLLYPVLVIHEAVSSWQSMKINRPKSLKSFRALLPLLSIVPLLTGIIFFAMFRNAA